MNHLILIPNKISLTQRLSFSKEDLARVATLRLFFVEEAKSARGLLRELLPDFSLQEAQFLELSEHTKAIQLREYLTLLKKQDAGIISESGCPCVADPGADLVALAHEANIDVLPLVGPSSILLALMASGLNGQSFAFNGYLPKDKGERILKIRQLEKRSISEKQTQIFMDTPYRNQSLLEDLLGICQPKTKLCIALDIGGADQSIKTKSIQEWQKAVPTLSKSPALFII